jgi:thiol:disulfide interchange protein DsbD
MAFSMFGAFELSLPSGLLNRLATVGGIGFRGAFLLGLVSGIVASPCTGPVLTGILAWIATTRDLWLGSLAMTAFALGLGVPFFAVGAFALSLPKSGRWMMTVKTVLGTVLLIVAAYFVGTTLSVLPRAVPFALAGWLWALGLGLGACVVSWMSTRFAASGNRVLMAIGILLFVVSGFFAVTKVTRTEDSLAWEHLTVDVAQARARRDNRPLLVDFTATWCGACKELDRLTFSSSAVKSEAQRFLTVKIDATHDDDPAVSRSLELLSVKGLPTVVLIDSTGHEVKRFTDFVPEGAFVEALRAVR